MNFKGKVRSELPSFQLAPMVDMIFILLSFFIATQIFARWETEIDVQLPTSDTGELPARLPGEIIVNVLPNGSLVVNRQTLDDENIGELFARIVDLFPGQPVLIRADKTTEYEHVVHVLDLCRKSDIWNISFATTASEGESAP